MLANVEDYVYDSWFNLFGLLKRNCINILIIIIRFSNSEAISCLIIIDKYNLVSFMHVIVFEVNGDDRTILLQQKTEKNDEGWLMDFKKAKKLQKVVG